MSAGRVATQGGRLVRPILSTDSAEARRRVLNLYKAWYRQIPYIVLDYDMPRNEKQCREKLREMFYKNKDVKDIRVIDTLIIKGQMELKEIAHMFKQKHHVMTYWKESQDPKPTDFLSKFLNE